MDQVGHKKNGDRRGAQSALGRGLGWMSLGLGASQVLAPRPANRWVGVREGNVATPAMFVVGVRELLSGMGILRSRHPQRWLWARVLGDVADLALLSYVVHMRRAAKLGNPRTTFAMALVGGVLVTDAVAAARETKRSARPRKRKAREHFKRTITVRRPPEEVYHFWRNFENLSKFMENVVLVTPVGHRRSHWVVQGPLGKAIEWDAEITDDEPGRRIAWRSVEGAEVLNMGTVEFLPAPGDKGTEVHVDIRYEAPGGKAGVAVAKALLKEPGQNVQADLRRLKQVLETGEVVHSDASVQPGPHPARPGGIGMGTRVPPTAH